MALVSRALWLLRLQYREVSQQQSRLSVLGDPGMETSGRLPSTQA